MVTLPQAGGIVNPHIARFLNEKNVLVEFRKAMHKQSIKMVGKGGAKVWGKFGSKFLKGLGWGLVFYDIGKACNCWKACSDDERFTESEKILFQ